MSISGLNGDYGSTHSYDSQTREHRIAKLREEYPKELNEMANPAADMDNQKRMAAESADRTNRDAEVHRSIKSTRQDRTAQARHAAAMEQQREHADIAAEKQQAGEARYEETTDRLQKLEAFSHKAELKERSAEQRFDDQKKAEQMLREVSDAAQGTRFDTRRPVPASMADEELARNPRGTTRKLLLENETLKNLGLSGYRVDGQVDVRPVKEAEDRVLEAKEDSISNVQRNAYQTAKSQQDAGQFAAQTVGRTEDIDTKKVLSDRQKSEVVKDYASMAFRARQTELRTTVTELVNP